MILNFIDEVLASAPKYRITHADNTTEEVSIDLATAVTIEGTPLDKALFDKIDKYLCPVGMITMWSGSTSNIPTGWALCNGSNGTPDLRNRFIVGAGSTYTVGETGGEATHTLTVDEMPSHNHNFRAYNGSGAGGFYDYLVGDSQVRIARGQVKLSFSDEMISSKGNGTAHENRPPYYALCYIMKISN